MPRASARKSRNEARGSERKIGYDGARHNRLSMTPPRPEEAAREEIDAALTEAGWLVQDMGDLNLAAGIGVAVREFYMAKGYLTGHTDDRRKRARRVFQHHRHRQQRERSSHLNTGLGCHQDQSFRLRYTSSSRT
jgi:hypothetical protein